MTAHDADPLRASSPPGLERPGGGWQVGVGPGAVVLVAGGEDRGTEPVASLGPTLAGVLAAAPEDDPTAGGPVTCAVSGHGPVAARLRRALGGAVAEDAGAARVVVHQHVVPPDVGLALARSGGVTVPVVVQPRRVLVGPVVGRPAGPCLHCLDLHRRDRDPAWPDLATAFGHPVEQLRPVPVPPPLVRATEGLVVLLVSSVLAGSTVSVGTAYELGASAPHVVLRRWTRHAACTWHP